jgi:hypothetical protein
MAWMHLWRATITLPKLSAMTGGDPAKISGNKEAAFYDGLVKTARYFITSVLPTTLGAMNSIQAMDDSVALMVSDNFSG